MVHRSGSGCFSPAASPENGNKMTLKGAESDCLTMADESDLLDQKSNKDDYYAVHSNESFTPVGQTHPNQNSTNDNKTIEINYTTAVDDESTKRYEESTSSNTFLESLSLTHNKSKPYLKMHANSQDSSGKPNETTNTSVNNVGESYLSKESDNKKCNDDTNIMEFKNSVNSFKNTCVERNIVDNKDVGETNLWTSESDVIENQSVRIKEISLPCKLPLTKLTDILDQISPKKLNTPPKTADNLTSDAYLRNSYVDVRDCLSNNLKMCPLGNVKSDIKILVSNERIVNTNNDNLDSNSLKSKTVILNSIEIPPRSLNPTLLNSNSNSTSPTTKKSVIHRILCLYCDKSFATATLQHKHSEKVHLVASNRRSSGRNASTQGDQCLQGCSFCSSVKGKPQIVAVTTDLRDLFKHLVNFHKESYFACEECVIRFTTLDILNTHKSDVHGEIVAALKVENKKTDKVENILDSPSTVPSSFKRSKQKTKSVEIAASSTSSNATEISEIEIDFEDNISVNIISSKVDDLFALPPKPALKEARLETKLTAVKAPLKMTRSQSSLQASNVDEPMLSRLGVAQNRSPRTRKILKSRKIDVKVQSVDRKNKSKNEVQEFVINKNINSKNELFDSKFDADFYQQVVVNVRDNLAHHLDGKLNGSLSNGRLSCPLSPPVKSNMVEITRGGEIHESNLSLKAISAFPTLLTFEQYGSNLTSGPASKITRKKVTKNSWKWKWDFIKKYKYYNENGKIVKKIKPSNLGQRDLSKLDMWTQLSMRTKHDAVVRKSGKKPSFETSEKNKKLRQLKSLNEILDTRLFPKLNLEQDAQEIKGGVKDLEIKHEYATTSPELSINDKGIEINKTKHISFEDTKLEPDIQPVRINSRRKSVRIHGNVTSLSLDVSGSACNVNNLELKPISQTGAIHHNTSSGPSDQSISSFAKTDQAASSSIESISENKDVPACLNLIPRRPGEYNCSEVDPILSGEWARPRCYICMCCGTKLLTSKQLDDHKTSQHPHIYSTHYEIVGKEMIDNELYKLFYLPGMKHTGKYVSDLKTDKSTDLSVNCIKNIENRVKTESEIKNCTKCGKELSNSNELYRHILECAGDYTWLLAKKKCKYRPFGRRSRRKKTRLPNMQIPRRRPTNVKPIRRTIKKDSGPRSKPSDAETIQRMLSNLPAKRSSRPIAPVPRPRNRPVSKKLPLKATAIRRTQNRETNQRITRNLVQKRQQPTPKQQNSKVNISKKVDADIKKNPKNVEILNKNVKIQNVAQAKVIKLGRRTIVKEDDEIPNREDLQNKPIVNKPTRLLKVTKVISSKIIDNKKVGARRKMTRGRLTKPITKQVVEAVKEKDNKNDTEEKPEEKEHLVSDINKSPKLSKTETFKNSLVKTLSFRKKNNKSELSAETKISTSSNNDGNLVKIKTPVLQKINRKTMNVIHQVARTLRNKKPKKVEPVKEINSSNELEKIENIVLVDSLETSEDAHNTESDNTKKPIRKRINSSKKVKLVKNRKKAVENLGKPKVVDKKISSVVDMNTQIENVTLQNDEIIHNDKLIVSVKEIDATLSNTLTEITTSTFKRNTNSVNKGKVIDIITNQKDEVIEKETLTDDTKNIENILNAESVTTKALNKSLKGNKKKLNKRNVSKEIQKIANFMNATKRRNIRKNASNELVTQTDNVKTAVELELDNGDSQLKKPVPESRNIDLIPVDAYDITDNNEGGLPEITNNKEQAKINSKSPKKSPKQNKIKSKIVRKLSVRKTKKYVLQKNKSAEKINLDKITLIDQDETEVDVVSIIDVPDKTENMLLKKKGTKPKSLKNGLNVEKVNVDTVNKEELDSSTIDVPDKLQQHDNILSKTRQSKTKCLKAVQDPQKVIVDIIESVKQSEPEVDVTTIDDSKNLFQVENILLQKKQQSKPKSLKTVLDVEKLNVDTVEVDDHNEPEVDVTTVDDDSNNLVQVDNILIQKKRRSKPKSLKTVLDVGKISVDTVEVDDQNEPDVDVTTIDDSSNIVQVENILIQKKRRSKPKSLKTVLDVGKISVDKVEYVDQNEPQVDVTTIDEPEKLEQSGNIFSKMKRSKSNSLKTLLDAEKVNADKIKDVDQNESKVVDVTTFHEPPNFEQDEILLSKKKRRSKPKSLKSVLDVLKGGKKRKTVSKKEDNAVVRVPEILKIPVIEKIMSAHTLVNNVKIAEDKIIRSNKVSEFSNSNVNVTNVIESKNILSVDSMPKIIINSENFINHNVESKIPKREILNIPFIKNTYNYNSHLNSEQLSSSTTASVNNEQVFQKDILLTNNKEANSVSISNNLKNETRLPEPILNIPKPVPKSPMLTKRPGKKLNDCIAMLTDKLQAKLSQKPTVISPMNSIFDIMSNSVNTNTVSDLTDSKTSILSATTYSEKIAEVKDQLNENLREKEVIVEKENNLINCHKVNSAILENNIELSTIDHLENVTKIFEVPTNLTSPIQESNVSIATKTDTLTVEPDTSLTSLSCTETLVEKSSEKMKEKTYFLESSILSAVNNTNQQTEDTLIEISTTNDIQSASIMDEDKLANNFLQDSEIIEQSIENIATSGRDLREYPTEELLQHVLDEVLVESINVSEDLNTQIESILPTVNDVKDLVNDEITDNVENIFMTSNREENKAIDNLSNNVIEKLINLECEDINSSSSEQVPLKANADLLQTSKILDVPEQRNELLSVRTIEKLDQNLSIDSHFINFESKNMNNDQRQSCIVKISLDKVGNMIESIKLLKNKIINNRTLNVNAEVGIIKKKNIRNKKGKRTIRRKCPKKQLKSCMLTKDILNTAIIESTSTESVDLNTAFIKTQNNKISRIRKNKIPRTGERRSRRNEILIQTVNNNEKLLAEQNELQSESTPKVCDSDNNIKVENLNVSVVVPEILLEASLETNDINKEHILPLIQVPNLENSESSKSSILDTIEKHATDIQISFSDSLSCAKSSLEELLPQTLSNETCIKELYIDIEPLTGISLEIPLKDRATEIASEDLQNQEVDINKPVIVDMVEISDNNIDHLFDKILIEQHNSVSVTPSNGSEIGIALDVVEKKNETSNISKLKLKSTKTNKKSKSNLNNKRSKVPVIEDTESINKNINCEINKNEAIRHENEDEPDGLEMKEIDVSEKSHIAVKDNSNDISDSDEDISLAIVAKKLSKAVNGCVEHDETISSKINQETPLIDEVVCADEDIMEKPETIITFEIIKSKKKRRYRKSILLNYKKNKPNKFESVPVSINTEESSSSKTENYCEICDKIFSRPESLSKHKMTLTHIAKLSEIEAREFFNNKKVANDETIESEQLEIIDTALKTVVEESEKIPNEIQSANIICIEDDSLNCKSNEDGLSVLNLNDKEVIDLDTSSTDSHSLIIEIDNAVAQDEYTRAKSNNNTNYSISIPESIEDEDEASIIHTAITYNQLSPKMSEKNEMTDIVNRKALSMEEALFFECCSLLKSSETTKQESEINTFRKNIFSAVSAVTEPSNSKMHLDLNQFSDISSDSNHAHQQQVIPHPPPSRIYQDDSSSNLTAFLASVDKFINAPVSNQTAKNDYASITENHPSINFSPISNNEQSDPKSVTIFNQNVGGGTHFSPISSHNESKSPSFFNGNVIFNHNKSASIINQITTNFSPISNHDDLDTPNESNDIYSNVSISMQKEKNNHILYSSNAASIFNQTAPVNLIEARTKNVYSEEALIVRTYSDTFSDMGDSYPSSQDASDPENYLQTINDRLTKKNIDSTNHFAAVKNVLNENISTVETNTFTADMHDVDHSPALPKNIEESSNNYFASQSPVAFNSPEQSHSSSKKFLTKGALKVFESIKVSIPTAEIDLGRIINTNETVRSKLAAFVDIALQDQENMRANSKNVDATDFTKSNELLSLEHTPEPVISMPIEDEADTFAAKDVENEDSLIIDEDICSDKDSLMNEKCGFSDADFKVTTRIENNKNILIINKTTKSGEHSLNKIKSKDVKQDVKETKLKKKETLNAKFGNTLGFKIKKKRSTSKKNNKKSPKDKKINAKSKTPKKIFKQTNEMDFTSKDIYDFEDSQDACELHLPRVSPVNTSLGYLSHSKPIHIKNDAETIKPFQDITESPIDAVENDDSQISSLSFSDRDDFTYISDNFSNPSDSEATQNTKLSVAKTENNPKCVIMGRIFKNAVKDKVDKIDKQNLDQLFDSLRTEKTESQQSTNNITKHDQLVNDNTSKEEQITEAPVAEPVVEQTPKLKNNKKVKICKEKIKKANSTLEVQDASDLGGIANSPKKKRKSREKVITENETIEKPGTSEDIGVAHRKSQRKCTTGKQNVLVEFWSSDEEFDLVHKKESKLKPEKRNGKIERSLKMNLTLANDKFINHLENELPEITNSDVQTTKHLQEENIKTNDLSDKINASQDVQKPEENVLNINVNGDDDIILQGLKNLKNLICNELSSEEILQEALLDTEDNIIQTNKQISALQKVTKKRRKSRKKSLRLDSSLDIEIPVTNNLLTEKNIPSESTMLVNTERDCIKPNDVTTENNYANTEIEQMFDNGDLYNAVHAVKELICSELRTISAENKNDSEKFKKKRNRTKSQSLNNVISINIKDDSNQDILPQTNCTELKTNSLQKSSVDPIILNTIENDFRNIAGVSDIVDNAATPQNKQKEQCHVTKDVDEIKYPSNQSSPEFKNGIYNHPEVEAPRKHKRRRKRASQSLKYVDSSSESEVEKEQVAPRAIIKKRRQTTCFTELNEITDNCEDDVRHQSDMESRGVKFSNDQNKRKLKKKSSVHYSKKSENVPEDLQSHHNKKQSDSKCQKPRQRRKRQDVNDDAITAAILSEPRRKRIASEMLYYWSSSSDDDQYAGMIEVKPIRDDVVNPGEQPIQHGWIVGDSHKKLVTLLAHTKGKKTEDSVVKEGSGKRSRHTM